MEKRTGFYGKKRIRSYLAFTSFGYRIIVCMALPVGVAAAGILAGLRIGDIGMLLVMAFLPMAEIVSDGWLFVGIQTKDREKMDYLKTSSRGMEVMQYALFLDLLRKFFTALGTNGICYLVIRLAKSNLMEGSDGEMLNLPDFIGRGGMGWEIGLLLYLVLLSYVVSVLGTFLSRYGSTVHISIWIGYGAVLLMLLGMYIVHGLFLSQSVWFYAIDFLYAILGIGVSILAVKTAMKKMEGGYYDERPENRL